jgi:hypothetical protein
MWSQIIRISASMNLPNFDETFSSLHLFILELVEQQRRGNVNSWNALESQVNTYFTSEKMDEMESLVPHWCKMASYADGRTLVHVMCVFLGLYEMPEFQAMSAAQQQIMKWVILFHDVEKEIPDGRRDYAHAFRSTVGAARTLPTLGFPVTSEYEAIIAYWDTYTRSALTTLENSTEIIQDNRKLPHIVDGIDRMFGHNTPAALILKTILLHLAIDMDFWPPPSPLTNEEVIKYVNDELAPLMLVMNLGDNEGWNMFAADVREYARKDTLRAFEKIRATISAKEN